VRYKLAYKHHVPISAFDQLERTQNVIRRSLKSRTSDRSSRAVLFPLRLLPFLPALSVRLKTVFALAVVVAIVSHALV